MTSGCNVLDFYLPDLDATQDAVNCFGPYRKKDWEKRDRSAIDNFIHPMTATEMWTLATFVSQILFGGETARRVEPRNPEDESKADLINELLRWNDNQQPTYNQGFHWCLDAITMNRGVMYDHWKDLMTVTLEPVEYTMPWTAPTHDEDGSEIPEKLRKKMKQPADYEPKKCTRFRKVRKAVGGFTKVDLISAYDFVCDPAFPLSRFQEGRFAGHRVTLPWTELKRRSELDPEDYQYVLPAVVEKLKNSKAKKVTSIASNSTTSTSRSWFERTRRTQPVTTISGSDKIDKEDGGVVECFCMQARLRPSTYKIFEDDEEEEKIEFLISGESDLLSVNVMTNKHDQFPYAVGEGRPNAHMQFGPSWAMIIRGPQAYVDYLCSRRRESLARTSGNIFIGHSDLVDFEAFTDPNKDGLFIPLTEQAKGKNIDQIIKQVAVNDTTANFFEEAEAWQKVSEEATGAHAPLQGNTENPSQTATQYEGDQTMATGRVSTIARLLSASCLVPQTDRIVSNLQQFLPDEMVIRISGKPDQFDPDKPQEKFMTIRRDASVWQDEDGNPMPIYQQWPDGEPMLDPTTGKPVPELDETGQPKVDERGSLPDIQGEFDTIPHDGAMPGTDATKVAALSRAIEVYSVNPLLAAAFDRTKPGAMDPIKLLQKMMKAINLPTEGIIVTRQDAIKNQQEALLAMGGGLGMPAPAGAPAMPPAAPMAPTPVPPMPTPAGPIPSATAVPAIPSVEPGPPMPA